jgi:hypothetical protein
LHNGGAPVFDLRIEGGNHEIEFETNDGERSILAETVSRDQPIGLHVKKKGLSGPLTEGHFRIRYLKISHEEEAIGLKWQMPPGLRIDQSPHTEVWQEDN